MKKKKNMKKLIFLSACVVAMLKLAAQQQPVKWSYTASKISDKVYEVHIHAVIDEGWHIYAQDQPEDAIAQPTKFKFTSNPLVMLKGKVKEMGKLEKHEVGALGIVQNQYSREVDFVQQVQLKSLVKTAVSGVFTFQVCTDEQCLLPKEVPFSVALAQ